MTTAAPAAGASLHARVVAASGGRTLLEVGGRLYDAAGTLRARPGETLPATVLAREGGALTLGFEGRGVTLRETSPANAAAALGLPAGPASEAALSVSLALGRPLDPAGLRALASAVAEATARFGGEHARAAALLRLAGIPAGEGSLRLASAWLSGGAPSVAAALVGVLRALRDHPAFRDARPDPARLRLAAAPAGVEEFRALLALLGFDREGGADFSGLLRGFAATAGGDGAAEATALAERLDAHAFDTLLDGGRYTFTLPWAAGEEPLDVAFEYRREGPDRHRFAFSVDLVPLGPLRAALDLAGRSLAVTLYAAEPAAKGILESGAGELAAALSARGFPSPAVRVHLAERSAIPLPARPAASPAGPASVDVTV